MGAQFVLCVMVGLRCLLAVRDQRLGRCRRDDHQRSMSSSTRHDDDHDDDNRGRGEPDRDPRLLAHRNKYPRGSISVPVF